MSHKIKDGIVIDSTIYMMDGKRKGFPIFMRLMQLLFLVCGSYSIISIFIESFFLPVRVSHIQMAVLLSSLLIFVLFLYPAFDWIKLGTAATVYLLVIRRFIEPLKNGFYVLENSILDQTGDYYKISIIKYKAQYSTAEEDLTLLIIMIIIPLISLLAYSLIRCRWINTTNIVTILPVAASFAVGITPSEGYLLTYLLTIIFISRSYGLGRVSSYKEQKFMVHRINSRAALVLSLITLVIFLMTKLVISEDHYEEVAKIRETKVELQDFMMNFSLEDVQDRINDITWLPKKSNVGAGGLNSGKLGTVDSVSFAETEQLKLIAPLKSVSEGMYLKGYVGSVYTGDSWKGHSKATEKKYEKLIEAYQEDRFEPVNQTVSLLKQIGELKKERPYWITPNTEDIYQQTFEFMKGTIQIEYKDANKKYIYAPYFTSFDTSDSARYEQDLYAAPRLKEEEYVFDYYFNLNIKEELSEYLKLYQESLGELSETERVYRRYVNDVYTQLPKEGLNRLKEEFNREKIGVRVDNIQKAVSYIKDYLNNNTSYTLSPGKLPKDKDFVEYFLYENKIGYCSHYASAGVMMLRAMGYPARYVEGYVVTASDVIYTSQLRDQKVTVYSDQQDYESYETQVEVSIKDYSAHAWVEIYMDGFGWFPVELTPSAGLDNTEEMIGDVGGVSEEITRDEESLITPTPEPVEPTEAPQEPEKAEDEVEPKDEKDKQEQENSLDSGKREDSSRGFLYLIAGFVILLTGILVALMLAHRRKRLVHRVNYNKKAILIYKEMERLFIYLNALPKKSRCLEDHLEYVRTNCPYIDGEDFGTVIETVKKARFGRSIISSKELEQVESFYKELSAKVDRKLSPIKRILLRIIPR